LLPDPEGIKANMTHQAEWEAENRRLVDLLTQREGEIERLKAMLKILLRHYLDSVDNEENILVKQVKALLNNQLE
jgi:hypothetical protein